MPDASRLSYGGSPAPGQPIAKSLGYRKTPERERLVVLRLLIERMDVLHLGLDHRRAGFERDDDWAGQWLVP